MERNLAIEELKGRLSNKNLIKHSLAVEAIMRSLAEILKDEADKWGLAGLLHDIDREKTAEDPSTHGVIGAEILETIGVDDSVVYAVRAHNDSLGIERKRKMDKALYAADPVSVFIAASALTLPDKKLEGMTVEYLLKKFCEEDFSKEADREHIRACLELGLSLEEFLEISLNAMKGVASELDL